MENRAEVIVAELEKRRTEIGRIRGRDLSDADFVKEFLPYSVTTLSRVRAGSYTGNVDRVLDAYGTALDEIDARLPGIRRAAEEAGGFVRTTLARAVLASAIRAKDAKTRRITVALAPTGSGKTAIGRYMESRGAVYVEGRRSWRTSYKAFCADVSEAAGQRIRWSRFSEYEAERAMLNALRARDGTLFIDEANTLGRATLDALKLITNQSGQSIVVAAIPGAWDDLTKRAEEEMLQLINRCQPVIRCSCVTASDAALFLGSSGIAESDMKEAAHAVSEAATRFGGYTLAETVSAELRSLARPSLEDLTKIIMAHDASSRAAGLTTKK